MDFIKYNKTGQFSDVVKQVRSTANYHGVPLPKIEFHGTVKLHGTNAAVVMNGSNFITQSRERIITPQSDNEGFAHFVHNNVNGSLDYLRKLYEYIRAEYPEKSGAIQIYGEWAGQGIQKNVGINKTPKTFYIFKIRIGNTSEVTDWINLDDINFLEYHPNIRWIVDYPSYHIIIDFNEPGEVQNRLIDLTNDVESRCPVAQGRLTELGIQTDDELTGEGIVWTSDAGQSISNGANPVFFNQGEYHFKVKGEKHSVSKVTTLAAVDPEKVKSISAFVDYAVTENRLNQGVEIMKQRNVALDRTGTGEFLKWVVSDIMQEEANTLAASMIEPKDVNSAISIKAREFWFALINKV